MTWRETEISPGLMSDPVHFGDHFGSVYEHSRWVAESARAELGGNATFGELALVMRALVDRADEDAKLHLLRAHPELAGRAALAGELTESSRREQSGAGLDRCSPDELSRLRGLNDAYRECFGFPFIVAVTGMDRSQVIANMQLRCRNDLATEFACALAQVHRIAELRLESLATKENSR